MAAPRGFEPPTHGLGNQNILVNNSIKVIITALTLLL
jgi:hypothetical protein